MSAQLPHYALSAALDKARGLAATPGRSLPPIEICEGLAACPVLSACSSPLDCLEVMHARGWRSMVSVIDGCGLGDSASRSKMTLPSGASPVAAVALCRYSSGYLVRLSAGADPAMIARRVEFATGTRDASIARLIRDAMYRGFDAIGALPVRSRLKWQAHLRTEPDDPDEWPFADTSAPSQSEGSPALLPITIIEGLVAAAESSGADLGTPLRQALDYLAINAI